MSIKEKSKYLSLLQEKYHKYIRHKIYNDVYFKENTKYSIEHYKKHSDFFMAGVKFKARLMLAGNRIGKTESCGLYELTLHAIGWYPNWWKGHRMDDGKDKAFFVVSDDFKMSRDIIQMKLLHDKAGAEFGTGLIPFDNILDKKPLQGTPGCYDYIVVKRNCGGTTKIFFKSSKTGRKCFQGTEADLVLLDEEPPQEVYAEAITRTMTTNGIVLLTFTPLQGLTELIRDFQKAEKEQDSPMLSITATWDDVPHLDEKQKKEMLALYPEWQRDARSKGIPVLGSGAIYPVDINKICVDPFEIPDYWPKWYGIDVGWRTTAVVFMAQDPDTEIMYVYDEIYVHELKPDEYVKLIINKGSYMEGVIDYAANMSSQYDGNSIRNMLNRSGLTLYNADKRVEYGINQVYEKLKFNRLKIFNTCINIKEEYNTYQRDEKGRIIKKNDHALDALRYAVLANDNIKKVKYVQPKDEEPFDYGFNTGYGSSWSN